MRNHASGEDPLRLRLKHFIVDALRLRNVRPDSITDDEALIDGRIGLDSLDALQLALELEQEFGVAIRDGQDSRAAFRNIASLADFICARTPENADRAQRQPQQVMMKLSA